MVSVLVPKFAGLSVIAGAGSGNMTAPRRPFKSGGGPQGQQAYNNQLQNG